MTQCLIQSGVIRMSLRCSLTAFNRPLSGPELSFAHQASAVVVLVILTLWLQCGGMGVLIYWTKTFIERSASKVGVWHASLLMVRFAGAMMVLHVLEILVWASFYRWQCFPSWEASFYFSASSFTTVGYGDVILPQTWRAIAPLESLIGILMCGMSVSGLFAILTRILVAEERSSAGSTAGSAP